MVRKMSKYDQSGHNRYYIDDGVVHMDVYNLCNVDNCDVMFDEQFLDKVICRVWRQVQKPGGVYISTVGKKDDPTKHITMHRFIMALAGNDITNKEIDHTNGNKFDNRLCNLRIVDHREQMFNLPPTHRNKLGIRGISVCKSQRNPYKIDFSCDGIKYSLKTFSKLQQAVYMRYLLESHYWDHVAVMRHYHTFDPYIKMLSEQEKQDILSYAQTVFDRYPNRKAI